MTDRNESGCACVIAEDGETILSACAAHETWKNAAMAGPDDLNYNHAKMMKYAKEMGLKTAFQITAGAQASPSVAPADSESGSAAGPASPAATSRESETPIPELIDILIEQAEAFEESVPPGSLHMTAVFLREAAASLAAVTIERDALSDRCDGYQASRDWAIDTLATALGIEPDKLRAVEYYARLAAEELEVARKDRT